MKPAPLLAAAVTLAASVASWHAAAADAPRPTPAPMAGPHEPGTVTVQARVRHGGNTLAMPHATLESGKSATMQFKAVALTVRPTAREDGTVEVASTLTGYADAARPQEIARIKVRVAAGATATVEVNGWELTLTPTVNK